MSSSKRVARRACVNRHRGLAFLTATLSRSCDDSNRSDELHRCGYNGVRAKWSECGSRRDNADELWTPKCLHHVTRLEARQLLNLYGSEHAGDRPTVLRYPEQ